MLPIYNTNTDSSQIDALRAKLSLKPLLLEGIGGGDDEDPSGTSKFETVRSILRDVQKRGDAAVLDYTQKFDKTALTAETMRVPQSAIEAAVNSADKKFLAALDIAIANLRHYQQAMMIKEPPLISLPNGGGKLGMKYTPIERVGLYVPGGAAAYPTSVLHTAIPAQIAGVKSLCLCSPMRGGTVSPAVLTAAHKLGITEIYAIGGAQAIAAMAFGTATIKPVDKIVGPGNTFVQLAKKELYGIVDIDSFAGPSEVIVLADDTAAPQQVAAELLAQAEHAPGSCLLITPSETLAKAVQQELEQQLQKLSREKITRTALEFASALIVSDSHESALALTDAFAPEHLQITTRNAREDAYKIKHAGAIFIGPFTPVAAGDYLAGPSHVLPTSGTARFFSGLSADSFRKRTSIVEFDQKTLDTLGQSIVDFALVEGFDAHAKSVSTRGTGVPPVS
ncbi:MAG TPA: histidinol dehydrogenase [Phycisphaerae bacterium]|nr:histidinol dehydrogenase [Phycisphaerae bacterium]